MTRAIDEAVLRLYSVAQLAELWSVSETYIRDEIRAGRLAIVQLGRGDRDKARVTAAEAARWLRDHTPAGDAA